MKRKSITAVVIVTIAVIFIIVIGLISWLGNLIENAEQDTVVYENSPIQIMPTPIYLPTVQPIAIDTPTPSAQATSMVEPTGTKKPLSTFASITISTDKKTRTYEIMPDVAENTLKRNIGWLPGSAMPGQEGLCVLMGHRDMDFRILQYVTVGDILTVTMSVKQYDYQVTKIEIIDNDNALRFGVQEGRNVVLVTCYPFRYSGNAPKKYIVYGVMKNT